MEESESRISYFGPLLLLLNDPVKGNCFHTSKYGEEHWHQKLSETCSSPLGSGPASHKPRLAREVAPALRQASAGQGNAPAEEQKGQIAQFQHRFLSRVPQFLLYIGWDCGTRRAPENVRLTLPPHLHQVLIHFLGYDYSMTTALTQPILHEPMECSSSSKKRLLYSSIEFKAHTTTSF